MQEPKSINGEKPKAVGTKFIVKSGADSWGDLADLIGDLVNSAKRLGIDVHIVEDYDFAWDSNQKEKLFAGEDA